MISSGRCNSSTFMGWLLNFSALRVSNGVCTWAKNCLRRSIRATHRFMGFQFEKRTNLIKFSSFSSETACVTTFFTSGSSAKTASKSQRNLGHSFSGCHKKSGPLTHRCRLVIWLPSKPRDASSARSFSESTCLHWIGSVSSRILCTRFATNTWKRFVSFRMYFNTVVMSVRYISPSIGSLNSLETISPTWT